MSDIFSIYNSFNVQIPKLMKVAMFLVFELRKEKSFDFSVVYDEERL